MGAFFPREEFLMDSATAQPYKQAEVAIFNHFKDQPLYRQIYAGLRQMNFERESEENRYEMINRLIDSAEAPYNSYVRWMRMSYLTAIYNSPLGQNLSGFRPPILMHPNARSYEQMNALRLPPTKLRYNNNSKLLGLNGESFDVAIVGSGPAGSMIAHELNMAGFSVVLIDKGPMTLPGVMNTRAFSEFKDNGNVRLSSDGAIMFRNGSAVGGGATVNIDLAFAPTLPLVRARIENWRRNGQISQGAFLPAEIERAYSYVKTKIGTRKLSTSEINANNRILWEGARRLNRDPSLYDLNTYAPGTSPSPVNDKRSPVDALIRPALENKYNPLILLEETSVESLEHAGGRRISRLRLKKQQASALAGLIRDPHKLGLRAGEEFYLQARHVIVSSGALGSAALLLRSQIKNNNIGKGMVGHVSMPIMGVFDKEIRAWEGTDASVYDASSALDKGYILESMSAEPSYVAMMTPGNRENMIQAVSSYSRLGGFGVMLIDTPHPSNQVRLNHKNETVIDYKISESDKRRMVNAVADAVSIMFAAGAKKVMLPTSEDVNGGQFTRASEVNLIRSQFQLIPNKTTITSAHMQSTNKMSTSPETGVVGPDFKVWGYENLYVCDASIFPTSIGANPMQSIYTFAKIFADQFKKAQKR